MFSPKVTFIFVSLKARGRAVGGVRLTGVGRLKHYKAISKLQLPTHSYLFSQEEMEGGGGVDN